MAKRTLKQNEISKRYGGVLFDLAQTNGTLKEVLKESDRLITCLHQEPREWTFITSPVIPLKTQVEIIQKMALSLKLSNLMLNFLKIVCHNHRLEDIPFILEDFTSRCKAASGIINGTVETAVELPLKMVKQLTETLKKTLGKDIFLEQSVDKTLLGGLIVRVDSFMIDASLKTQLTKLRHKLKE